MHHDMHPTAFRWSCTYTTIIYCGSASGFLLRFPTWDTMTRSIRSVRPSAGLGARALLFSTVYTVPHTAPCECACMNSS